MSFDHHQFYHLIIYYHHKIVNKIGESINNYLSNGYKLDDIVILTLNTEDSSILSGVSKINNFI